MRIKIDRKRKDVGRMTPKNNLDINRSSWWIPGLFGIAAYTYKDTPNRNSTCSKKDDANKWTNKDVGERALISTRFFMFAPFLAKRSCMDSNL